jgi:hypothetical protein
VQFSCTAGCRLSAIHVWDGHIRLFANNRLEAPALIESGGGTGSGLASRRTSTSSGSPRCRHAVSMRRLDVSVVHLDVSMEHEPHHRLADPQQTCYLTRRGYCN